MIMAVQCSIHSSIDFVIEHPRQKPDSFDYRHYRLTEGQTKDLSINNFCSYFSQSDNGRSQMCKGQMG